MVPTVENKSEDSCQGSNNINTWHTIIGHCNYDDIKKLPIKEKTGTITEKPVSRENFPRVEIDNPTDV